jgi:hypothetical protein
MAKRGTSVCPRTTRQTDVLRDACGCRQGGLEICAANSPYIVSEARRVADFRNDGALFRFDASNALRPRTRAGVQALDAAIKDRDRLHIELVDHGGECRRRFYETCALIRNAGVYKDHSFNGMRHLILQK